jgi:hypothetical protein
MRNDIDDSTTRDGIGAGTLAAIAAVLLIVGALFFWPRDTNHSASSTAPGTTVGQTRTAPAPTAPSPAPAAPTQTK